MPKHDIAVIGGGIVGLATALQLRLERPDWALVVVEKESGVAQHQSGRNSGVIHAGNDYKPGSLRAELCRAGHRSMVRFCEENSVPFDLCGKLIVATGEEQLGRLKDLHERSLQNSVKVRWLSREEAKTIEPAAESIAAIHILEEGITDYAAVCHAMAGLLEKSGVPILFNTAVQSIKSSENGLRLLTNLGELECSFVVNCAGLQSDRIAKAAGVHDLKVRIIPFRGEFFTLREEIAGQICGMIYPVPDLSFPFLGVHVTRSIRGGVHAGPNAVLALKREGYQKTDFSMQDAMDVASHRGFLRFAARHFKTGIEELHRSFVRKRFAESLQRLVPGIREEDLVPCASGVRAQAMSPEGKLADDFIIMDGPRSVHVCNAPSPAATASLEIAKVVAGRTLNHAQAPQTRVIAPSG